MDVALTNTFIVHSDICARKQWKAKTHVDFLCTMALSVIGVAIEPSGVQRRSRLLQQLVRPMEETDQWAHTTDLEQAPLAVENSNGSTSLAASSPSATESIRVPPLASVQTSIVGLLSGAFSVVATEAEIGAGACGRVPSLGRDGGIPPPPSLAIEIPPRHRRGPRLQGDVL